MQPPLQKCPLQKCLAPPQQRFADGGFFEGDLDEVEIYDEPLDLMAIQDLAAAHGCPALLFANGFDDRTTDTWSIVVP